MVETRGLPDPSMVGTKVLPDPVREVDMRELSEGPEELTAGCWVEGLEPRESRRTL